jgi:WD40 repeat protein
MLCQNIKGSEWTFPSSKCQGLTLCALCPVAGVLTGNVLYAEPSSEVVYTCGPLVVAMAAPPAEGLSAAAALAAAAGGGDASGAVLRPQGAQRVFLGHTRHVSALCLDEDATLLATAQEGKEGVVRLWDFATGKCLALLCGEWRHHASMASASHTAAP